MYGEGISQVGEIIDMASEKDIVNKSGAWYAYKGERIGQGRENAKKFLLEHPEMRAEIEKLVRDEYGIGDKKAVEIIAEEKDEMIESIDLLDE